MSAHDRARAAADVSSKADMSSRQPWTRKADRSSRKPRTLSRLDFCHTLFSSVLANLSCLCAETSRLQDNRLMCHLLSCEACDGVFWYHCLMTGIPTIVFLLSSVHRVSGLVSLLSECRLLRTVAYPRFAPSCPSKYESYDPGRMCMYRHVND